MSAGAANVHPTIHERQLYKVKAIFHMLYVDSTNTLLYMSKAEWRCIIRLMSKSESETNPTE